MTVRKIIHVETTFASDLAETAAIEAGVEAVAAKVWGWCEKTGTYGRTLTVKVKFADFHQITRSHSFTSAIACEDQLKRASIALVRTILPTAKSIRLLGVTVSNFDHAAAEVAELPLFMVPTRGDGAWWARLRIRTAEPLRGKPSSREPASRIDTHDR